MTDDPDDQWSFEARQAREDARRLAAWEERRRGRPIRLWEAEIEVRVAALDLDDAWWRLCVWLRHPCHRVRTSLLHNTVDLEIYGHNHQPATPGEHHEVELAADAGEEERLRLELDYPSQALPRPAPREVYGPSERAEVAAYAIALRHGADRLLGRLAPADEAALAARPPLPPGTGLDVWRAVHRATFLAVDDEAPARAQELAATIVDWAGRPHGRVLRVAPDDGFRSAKDGRWLHPGRDLELGDAGGVVGRPRGR